jgi:hypothetical protein
MVPSAVLELGELLLNVKTGGRIMSLVGLQVRTKQDVCKMKRKPIKALSLYSLSGTEVLQTRLGPTEEQMGVDFLYCFFIRVLCFFISPKSMHH